MLAKLLKSAVPDQVELVEKGLFKKNLVAIVFNQSENQFRLEDAGGRGLQATFTRVVRGIALKTEPISVQEWIACVSEAVESHMKESEEIRAVMARSLGLP